MFFIRSLIPHDLASLKDPTFNIITLGLGSEHMDLGGMHSVQNTYGRPAVYLCPCQALGYGGDHDHECPCP